MPSVDLATAAGALLSLPAVLSRLVGQGTRIREPGAVSRAVLLSAALRAHLETIAGPILVVAPEEVREHAARVFRNDADPSRDGTRVRTWDGAMEGAALRSACREAARVLYVTRSGRENALSALTLTERLGREPGVGCVLLGVGPALATSADRVGDLVAFWNAPEPTDP